MIDPHDAAGLAGLAFVLATALAASVTARASTPATRRTRFIAVGVVLLAASMAPVAGLPLIAQVRAVPGDPSVPTIVLAAAVCWARLGAATRVTEASRIALAALTVIGALLLYPFALGATLFDPYRLGYGSALLVGAVLAIALAAALTGRTLITVSLAFGVLGWTAGVYGSTNLFDYLLDPMLVVWAVTIGIGRLMGLRRK